MFKSYGFGGNCAVLGVLCGKSPDGKEENLLPKLTSSGRLEVHLLRNPSVHQFQHSLKSISPSFLYLRGEQWGSEDRSGSVVLDGVYPSNPETFSSLIGPKLPNMVYLEIPNGRKFADALYAKGIPYVIYWETELPNDGASQFRQALLSVIQSSRNHPWDTFQLAHASFRLYCARDNIGSTIKSQNMNGNLESNGPCLLGNAPKITIPSPENIPGEGDDMSDNLPSIKIYDDDVKIKFLICGPPCPLDARLLGSIEDGLNALLNIEIRGSKLHHRISAVPPPLQAGAFSRGVITMRCDLTTSSSAHISLLVSSSAQTCFDDQLLENHIKKELTESRKLVKAIFHSEENNPFFTDPRMSCSIACGSPVFEVCMKVPTWASQVLKQLAPEVSYRSLVSLGVASIQGSSVASFEKEDAQRLLSFTTNQGERLNRKNNPQNPPAWLKCPPPTRKRSMSIQGFIPSPQKMFNQKIHNGFEERRSSVEPPRKRLKTAAMKPIPYAGNHRSLPFPGEHANGVHDRNHVKTMIPTVSFPRNVAPATVSRKKASSNSFREKTASMGPCFNPLPLKKHDCSRCPIGSCSEEDFLKDVMEFLIQRGNHKLVPLGGLQEFPDAILNAKRLDLYNLYREVVTRGGYLVGNGINWKGQVFSKMRNHTATNKMTGVGNTLKRHYETYLAEYELAHDDVDGECCLLCNSSEAGDWVNCGLCGEWAHFGCDKRQGLGAFKDYAKTDGLEYVCPQCSIRNYRKKRSPRIRNGTTHAPISMRTV